MIGLPVRRLARWEVALVVLLAGEVLVLDRLNPGFLDLGRLLASSSDYVWVGIIALPLTLVMIGGGIDISVGSVVSLTSITMGMLWTAGLNIWLAALCGLGVALVAGLVNGGLIVLTDAQPLVITLGTLFLYAGVAVGASGLLGVSAYEGISGLPPTFVQLANGSLLGVPNPLLAFLATALLAGLVLHTTPLGRRTRLIGVNPRAARYAGINVQAVLVSTYALTGLGAGLAGVLLTSYFASARADLGATALLPVVTTVVIGGVSIYGGVGTVAGVAVATFVIGLLQQGLRFAGLSNDLVTVLVGAVLVSAAALRYGATRLVAARRARRVRRVAGVPPPGAAARVALTGRPEVRANAPEEARR